MRWCVSIGAVLVAGAMAGGDVAGIAAPGPKNQLSHQLGQRSADKKNVNSSKADLGGPRGTQGDLTESS